MNSYLSNRLLDSSSCVKTISLLSNHHRDPLLSHYCSPKVDFADCNTYFTAVTLWLCVESGRYHWRLGMRFTCMGMNIISHLVLELGFRKENNEYVVQVSLVRFGSSSVIHYSFLALPSQYHHLHHSRCARAKALV